MNFTFNIVPALFNFGAIAGQVALGLIFLSVSINNIKVFRRIKYFVSAAGLVTQAGIYRLSRKSSLSIRFSVKYSYLGVDYEGEPLKYRLPCFTNMPILEQLREKHEGNIIDIRVNPQKPNEFVFEKDAHIPIYEWIGWVMVPAIFAAVCFACPVRF
jgi:hypothetical protein